MNEYEEWRTYPPVNYVPSKVYKENEDNMEFNTVISDDVLCNNSTQNKSISIQDNKKSDEKNSSEN